MMSLSGGELSAGHDFIVAFDFLPVIEFLFHSVDANRIGVDQGNSLDDSFGLVELMLDCEEARRF